MLMVKGVMFDVVVLAPESQSAGAIIILQLQSNYHHKEQLYSCCRFP